VKERVEIGAAVLLIVKRLGSAVFAIYVGFMDAIKTV
jgi:hypothetical protein